MTLIQPGAMGAAVFAGVMLLGCSAAVADPSGPSAITPHASYVGESASVIDGGLRRGTDYAGQLAVGVDIASGAWTGGETPVLHVTATQRHGANASQKLIGNSISAQEVYGGGDTYRLAEF